MKTIKNINISYREFFQKKLSRTTNWQQSGMVLLPLYIWPAESWWI